MTVTEPSAQVLSWMREGEARFFEQVDALPDAELRTGSALPDWTRAHVVAHVARNAEAMCRLLSWARTGTKQYMYPDTDARNRDIESSAGQDAEALRSDLKRASAQFVEDVETLPDGKWSAQVRTFHGRDIPASFVVFMRVREVWLHLVDLGTGASVETWPGELVDALLDDVTATMTARPDAPSIHLHPTDRDRDWLIGTDPDAAQNITGTAADILAWLTGRSTGDGLSTEGTVPVPPHWM